MISVIMWDFYVDLLLRGYSLESPCFMSAFHVHWGVDELYHLKLYE